MSHYHTQLQVSCRPEYSEILIAELAAAGFDTFLENDNGFEAYAEEDHYDRDAVESVRQKYESAASPVFTFSLVPKKNWNEAWEKSYEPIAVGDECLIRAAFHEPDKKYPYEIIITPKMSFGTGHHQTTYLMIKSMLAIDHKGKRVMDAGCGTAILSIMACKRGAKEVAAFDIDEWSVVNGEENATINGCSNIRITRGTIAEANLSGQFDIILANINKNVLMDEMSQYVAFLKKGGLLLLSGFFSFDIPDLLRHAGPLGLAEVRREERETWAALLLMLG